jgi:hypothetical protein
MTMRKVEKVKSLNNKFDYRYTIIKRSDGTIHRFVCHIYMKNIIV